ncbi:hypothetical protein E2I00_001776, partial [Balaenoptera physalus]
MMCLLLALGLALMCGTQAVNVIQTMENLDIQKGDLEIILQKREKDGCAKEKIIAEKTEIPAVFKIN